MVNNVMYVKEFEIFLFIVIGDLVRYIIILKILGRLGKRFVVNILEKNKNV